MTAFWLIILGGGPVMRKSSRKKTRIVRKSSKKQARPIRKILRKVRLRIARKPLKKLKIQQFILPIVKAPEPVAYNPVPAPAGFELPERYGEDKLALLVRDPWWIYAYWETTPEREREVLHQIERSACLPARQGSSSQSKVLRVYDVTDKPLPDHHSFFDIEIGFAGNWYVDVGRPDREWVAEIGFRKRDGRFFALVRSNVVRTPRFGVSDVCDEEWLLPDDLYWKVFGLSGGIGGRKSSLDVKEILERYLRGLGASENSPNFNARPSFSPEAVLEKK